MKLNKKAYCYKCNNETNQTIQFETTQFDTNSIHSGGKESKIAWVVEKTDWKFYCCKGCESNNLEIITYHSGSNQVYREMQRKLLPGKSKHKAEEWIFKLDNTYIELLSEIYSSFNNGSLRLSMMGVRTLIDMFIVDNIGDKGTFQQKLKSLKSENFISNIQYKLLETSIEAGNASAHRGYKPSEKIMSSVLEIVENLLKPLAIETQIKTLEKEIPKRQRT